MTIKVGDRVRIAVDGIVDSKDSSHYPYQVCIGDGAFSAWFRAEDVSKIVGPEPQWRVGDAVIFTSVQGRTVETLIWSGTYWRNYSGDSFGSSISVAWADRRIVRLVPEVQS